MGPRWLIVWGAVLPLLAGASFSGCPIPRPPGDPPGTVSRVYDFRNGAQEWQALFADYAPQQEALINPQARLAAQPPELGVSGTAYLLGGTNVSDDLLMLLYRRLGPEDGIVRGRTYQVRYRILFASNAPSGCIGIGGPPGESVYLKAGAANVRPTRALDDQGIYRLNVDFGQQSGGGLNATVVGTIANGFPCESIPDLSNAPYRGLIGAITHTRLVTPNDAGEIYLIFGTDSGFEGRTEIYYQRVEVTLVPRN